MTQPSSQVKDWDDVMDVLFDGTEEEIRSLKSPKGHALEITCSREAQSIQIVCHEEQYLCRAETGKSEPNCFKHFAE